MINEIFTHRRLSLFQANPIVRAFIVSETFFSSAWNFIMPIFAIFVLTVPGGNVEIAGICYSIHLITRIIAEIIVGKVLAQASDKRKFIFTLTGMVLLSAAYLMLMFAQNVLGLFSVWALIGTGIGISAPAKNSLFAMHLDKHKEAEEWGIYDAVVLAGVACAATLGALIASRYGFTVLFLLSAIFNTIGMIPYVLYLYTRRIKQ